jgi:hypothetical protein
MAKKPAIQMTNGIDDIIKGGIAVGRKIAKRVSKAETKFLTRNMKSDVSQITKKEAKRNANYPKIPKTRRGENKLAKKYAKERVVIQKKYDAQIAGDKGAQRAIKYAEIDAILKKKTAARRAGGSKF